MMKTFLVILSTCFFVSGTIPYLVGVVKRQVRPKVMTWFIWTLLALTSFSIALIDGRYTTAILLFCSAASTSLVVIFGWKYGDKKIGRLDIFCLFGALIGLLFWVVFDTPEIAVLITIGINIIGGVPTMIHAWSKPSEEAWASFCLAFVGAFFTLLTLESFAVTAFAYPFYIFISNVIFTTIILGRRRLKIVGAKK